MKMLHNLRNSSRWYRVLFVILFAIILYITQYLIFLVSLLQAIFTLFSSSPNTQLQKFGAGLGEFTKDLTRFMTYNTDKKPFPFSDWSVGEKPSFIEDITTVNMHNTSEKNAPKPKPKTRAQKQQAKNNTKRDEKNTTQPKPKKSTTVKRASAVSSKKHDATKSLPRAKAMPVVQSPSTVNQPSKPDSTDTENTNNTNTSTDTTQKKNSP